MNIVQINGWLVSLEGPMLRGRQYVLPMCKRLATKKSKTGTGLKYKANENGR